MSGNQDTEGKNNWLMKVTVTKSLNVRVGRPSVNAPIYQNLAPGSELEVDGTLYKGDSYDGIDTWLKDAAGNYYWSGGVESAGTQTGFQAPEKTQPTDPVDYRKYIKVQGPMPGENGAQIRIAVLDTGLNVTHMDIKRSNIFLGEIHNSWAEIEDHNGHGTSICGLLCADSHTGNGITGLVPSASLSIFKVLNDDLSVNVGKIADAIRSIVLAGNYDLINMSFNVTEQDYNTIQFDLETLSNDGTIMVAAAGNGEFLATRSFYPAISSSVISAGTIDDNSLQLFKSNGFYKSVDFFFLNEKLKSLSYNSNGYSTIGACSAYTAIVTGLVARLVSSAPPKSERFGFIASQLNSLASPFGNIDNLTPGCLYKTLK